MIIEEILVHDVQHLLARLLIRTTGLDIPNIFFSFQRPQ